MGQTTFSLTTQTADVDDLKVRSAQEEEKISGLGGLVGRGQWSKTIICPNWQLLLLASIHHKFCGIEMMECQWLCASAANM